MTPRDYGLLKVAYAAGLIKEAVGAQAMGPDEGGGGNVSEVTMEPMDIEGSVKKDKGPAPKAKPATAAKKDDKPKAKPATKKDTGPAPKADFAQQAQSSIDDLSASLGDVSAFGAGATPGNPLEYDMEPMDIRGQAPAGGGGNPFANLEYLDPFSDEAAFADVGGAPAPQRGDRVDQMLASLNLGGGGSGGNF